MAILSFNNYKQYYNVKGDGYPILFLHGLGSTGIDWKPQYDIMCVKYKCILPDLRGHGNSDKPNGPYSISQMADDILQLIKSIERCPVHVVGISMGGAVAFQLAHIRPDIVKSMVIINSVSDWRMKTFGERFKLGQRKLIVRLMGMKKMGEVLANRLLPKSEHESLRLDFIRKWAKNDTSAYLNSLNALVDWSISSDDLIQMKMPTLFIASDQDYSPISKKEKIANYMPNAQLNVIKDARHAVTVEHPNQVNQLLQSFFNQYTNL
ncbi:MAG: alpha/beta hydrolase [Candidatus Marinimicrobia bacterium]|jgi:pimeloyl-ACP methyl ester carboxylesterase|nr:alpha/beta hydrolase [Candidatus Neomarinimicrobiota bacterium]MBT4636258.1 alpha/beta hydrolase [Candidatus Neomarinimicrobiota bacterium]MBT4685313.1 alpha/beta hydrolase [Candidatus Neomarinimicrobiota bacterium]MBT4734723.1 alpha/beta hydrolase [Candidatus Neomarinimicrobiota bacterium]MBT5070088.1 alpha/beta hydrolase [Candidatus Neomarinimicrobiota bacterium]